MAENSWQVGDIIRLVDVLRWDDKVSQEELEEIQRRLTAGEITVKQANNLAKMITLTLAGDLKGSVEFDGSGNITLTATINKATQVEAEAGTNSTKFMTPQQTKQAIDKLTRTETVNRIANSSRTNASGVLDFPIGISVMHAEAVDAGFPNRYGTLTTFRANPSTYQDFIAYQNGNKDRWYRVMTGNTTWSDWVKIANAADMNSGFINTLPMNSLGNNALPSQYPVGVSIMICNIPLGFPEQHATLVTNKGGNTQIVQTLTSVLGNNKLTYTRTTTGTPEIWSVWQVNITDKNLGDYVSNKSDAENGIGNEKLMTPIRTKEAIDKQATSSKINLLPWNSMTIDNTPKDYPQGISSMLCSSVASNFPGQYGVLTTHKTSDRYVVQTYQDILSSGLTYTRNALTETTWSTFKRLASQEETTTEAVNKLRNNRFHNSSTMADYPVGLTVFRVADDVGNQGYPAKHGIVVTNKSDGLYAYQTFKTLVDNETYERHSGANGYTAWEKISKSKDIAEVARPASEPPANYKDGLTLSSVGSAGLGYPSGLGQVLTVKESQYRVNQFFMFSGASTGSGADTKVWARYGRADITDNNGWTTWTEIVMSGVGASQLVNKLKENSIDTNTAPRNIPEGVTVAQTYTGSGFPGSGYGLVTNYNVNASGNHVYQIYQKSNEDFAMYKRQGNGLGSWGAWKKIAHEEDTGWLVIPTTDNVTYSTLRYRRKNGLVFVRGELHLARDLTSSGSPIVANLPEGYRPDGFSVMNGVTSRSITPAYDQLANFTFNTDGAIKLVVKTGTEYAYHLTHSFPV